MKNGILRTISMVILISSSVAMADFKPYANYYKCDLPGKTHLSWNLGFGWADAASFFGVYNTGRSEGFYYKKNGTYDTFFQYSISGATFTVPNTMLDRNNPVEKAVIGYGNRYSNEQKETTCILIKK